MISAWFKLLAAPIAAVALFALAPAGARADTVAFHTVVTFTSGPSFALPSGAVTLTNGGTVLTFTGNGDTLTAAGSVYGSGSANPDVELYAPFLGFNGLPVSLGTLTASSGSLQLFGGVGVKIDVFQDYTTPPTLPPGTGAPVVPGNTGAFVGSVTGVIQANSAGGGTLTFDQPPSFQFTLPNPPSAGQLSVQYTVDPTQQITFNSSGVYSISGEVAAVPLPATASTGLSLLACVGCTMGAVAFRRRRMGSAV